jgi:hypothetical protein
MASSIDPTKPIEGRPQTSSVRANFQSAKDEIESLQANGIEGLTTAEVDQLKNIDTTTVSSVQWGYLGAAVGGLVDLSTAQTLTNKTINLANNTLTGTAAEFNTALSDGNFATLAGVETLTNKTLNLSSNILSGTTVQFNTALSDGSFTTLTGTEALTNKTIDDLTNFIRADGIHIKARNVSGGTLTRGTPVYVSDYNSGENAIEVLKADADVAASMPAFAVIDEDIANNANGSVLSKGVLTGDATHNLNTSSWSVGDELYVSATIGTLTNVRPATKNDAVQKIGVVLRSHASLGSIFINGADRSNDLPNTGTAEKGFLGKSFNLGNLNSATTLHINDGNIQHGTMTGSFALTAPDDTDVGYCEVELTIDATGGYTFTPSGFNVISGTVDTTANVVNLLRVSKLNTNTYLEITQAA